MYVCLNTQKNTEYARGGLFPIYLSEGLRPKQTVNSTDVGAVDEDEGLEVNIVREMGGFVAPSARCSTCMTSWRIVLYANY